FFVQAEDGIRDFHVTGVQTCALPIFIAASHVLHRPLVPRHPPCALHTLTTKMLAPTIQFSNNNPASKHTHSVFPHNPTASSPASGSTKTIEHDGTVLLRKEVIQPHLPVRLPRYDFVPVASPTVGLSLPHAGVGPSAAGVADFHDVTGGVYKARERIHRSIADLRLQAAPASRGRVADPDPN